MTQVLFQRTDTQYFLVQCWFERIWEKDLCAIRALHQFPFRLTHFCPVFSYGAFYLPWSNSIYLLKLFLSDYVLQHFFLQWLNVLRESREFLSSCFWQQLINSTEKAASVFFRRFSFQPNKKKYFWNFMWILQNLWGPLMPWKRI